MNPDETFVEERPLTVTERLERLEDDLKAFAGAVKVHTHDKESGVAVVVQRL